MFSYHDFIMSTITRMVRGGETDYRVMQYAATYYDKGVLTDSDMEHIQALIIERDTVEEPTEEAPETEQEPTTGDE